MLNPTLLGKKTTYPKRYSPHLLQPIARQFNREKIGVSEPLPFYGEDIWNAYELSWLNEKGKPIAAVGKFIIPCSSPFLIESKSFKLYLNSFNNERFHDINTIQFTMQRDLESCLQAPVIIQLFSLTDLTPWIIGKFSGICLDHLDVSTTIYQPDPTLLTTKNEFADEVFYSHLLKSNCPITNQPDWASVQIHSVGPKINRENLLKYLISYRNHAEFHEACVERIFMDIKQQCHPQELTIFARYTRRGGLDINPYRSTQSARIPRDERLWRQ